MPTVHARHFRTGDPVAVTHDGRAITAVGPSAESPTVWVAPAFVDVQINGGLGLGFGDPALTPDQVRTVTTECHRHGIGAFLPTVITGESDRIRAAFANLARVLDADPDLARRVPGFHLEGPYISADDGPRGAHPREFARDPDPDEFRRWQDAAGGRIRMVTLAPERPGALAFTEALAAAGVVVAIGHTAASPREIRAAVAAGAKTSTHLGNGSHAVLPRHDNYLWEQLGADELFASVIPDGHHLPPAVVKTIVRAKTPRRVLITCDAGPLAGSPPGRYRDWGTDLDVLPSGKIVVAGTPFLAGSGHFTDVCVGGMAAMAGVRLADAIDMATARPRELLSLPPAGLEVGDPADLVVFDWEPGGPVRVRATVLTSP